MITILGEDLPTLVALANCDSSKDVINLKMVDGRAHTWRYIAGSTVLSSIPAIGSGEFAFSARLFLAVCEEFYLDESPVTFAKDENDKIVVSQSAMGEYEIGYAEKVDKYPGDLVKVKPRFLSMETAAIGTTQLKNILNVATGLESEVVEVSQYGDYLKFGIPDRVAYII